MIGVYDYTVIATYLATILGICGIFQASDGRTLMAILCLLLAGLLDTFDGRIARSKKNRTQQEKRFGIQIDSLNDLICFGVLPAAICRDVYNSRPTLYDAGGCAALFTAVLCFFVLAGLIRLAYFNVMEEERQKSTDSVRKYYLGVPVTSAAFMIPAYYLLALYGGLTDCVVYGVGLFILGVAFITPIHVPKPGLRGIIVMSLIGAAELALFILATMGL